MYGLHRPSAELQTTPLLLLCRAARLCQQCSASRGPPKTARHNLQGNPAISISAQHYTPPPSLADRAFLHAQCSERGPWGIVWRQGAMADQNGGGRGVPLTGGAVYDEDLYGGANVTGYAAVAADLEEEELDEREQAVAR